MIKQLKPGIHQISVQTYGEKMFDKSEEELEDFINEDILLSLPNVTYSVVAADIEDIMDYRTNKQCAIFRVDALILFRNEHTDTILDLLTIENYIETQFIKPIGED